jgi:hypothetical protein
MFDDDFDSSGKMNDRLCFESGFEFGIDEDGLIGYETRARPDGVWLYRKSGTLPLDIQGFVFRSGGWDAAGFSVIFNWI